MILTLIIFSQLCIIFAVWRISKKRPVENVHFRYLKNRKLEGKLDKYYLTAKLAEKMADRAFNMASSANVGIVTLQKALAVPRLMTKKQGTQNEVAKNGIDKLFTKEGNMEWLRPILSDEENDLLDEAEALRNKEIMNGSKG